MLRVSGMIYLKTSPSNSITLSDHHIIKYATTAGTATDILSDPSTAASASPLYSTSY